MNGEFAKEDPRFRVQVGLRRLRADRPQNP